MNQIFSLYLSLYNISTEGFPYKVEGKDLTEPKHYTEVAYLYILSYNAGKLCTPV